MEGSGPREENTVGGAELVWSVGEGDSFRAGLASTLPLVAGVLALGLAYGLTARQTGLSLGHALLMSLTVFAGAAQFSALQVWNTQTELMVIAVVLVVNLRYLLMSASLAPLLHGHPWPRKMVAAFMLSDESYALSVARHHAGQGSFAYLIGANIGLYVEWATASLVGAAVGSLVPPLAHYRLDLIFPLAFLALLVPLITDRLALGVALVATALALVCADLLPGKWYLARWPYSEGAWRGRFWRSYGGNPDHPGHGAGHICDPVCAARCCRSWDASLGRPLAESCSYRGVLSAGSSRVRLGRRRIEWGAGLWAGVAGVVVGRRRGGVVAVVLAGLGTYWLLRLLGL